MLNANPQIAILDPVKRKQIWIYVAAGIVLVLGVLFTILITRTQQKFIEKNRIYTDAEKHAIMDPTVPGAHPVTPLTDSQKAAVMDGTKSQSAPAAALSDQDKEAIMEGK